MTTGYEVIGIEASPYSVKVRAVLRYRRLAHVWTCRMAQLHPPLAGVRPLLMPVVRFPDGGYRVDSTPIILSLEAAHPGRRSVQPDDPVLALFSLMIEDMADEWLSKCLFHYRFAHDADRAYAPLWVMDDAHPGIDSGELAEKTRAFLERQSERMALVGATADNAPVIEGSLRRILDILEPFVALDRFLFGTRPSLADFGLFGQLKTLCTDPTPLALIRASAPRTEHWVRRADDLSGLEGEWQASPEPSAAVMALAAMAGDTYLPFLAANARAISQDRGGIDIALPGGRYRQQPFGYQVKCLKALRDAYAALPPGERERADGLLRRCGCLPYLTGEAEG